MTFLTEAKKNTLNIFDVDETLFHTKAKILVKKGGKVVRSLDNVQFNKYKLKSGEEFDFAQFRSAELFNKTSTPVTKMVDLAKRLVRKQSALDQSIIVTARADFDDKKLFLKTFRDHGIDIDNIYVERGGNLGGDAPHVNKQIIFNNYLKTGRFEKVNLFDDSAKNLDVLLQLKNKYPTVKMNCYLVLHDGSIRAYKSS
jgi:major membrane immunogen (membrane-anchored lipoprotein)